MSISTYFRHKLTFIQCFPFLKSLFSRYPCFLCSTRLKPLRYIFFLKMQLIYNFKHVSIVPYSPNMNAYAERFIRSARNECLDYFLIFTENQLRRIIRSYIDYYNNYRPHQGIKGIPNGPPEEFSKTGKIRRKPLLLGLHSHYYREAV